ncbi:hypothetical protein ACKKBG_A27510 [Auxenochlorella protothecoides x Auxenochlorella symbiontica]
MTSSASIQRWVTTTSNCREDEIRPVLLSFGGFGMVLASYFFLLPLRDEAGVALGTTALPVLFAASLLLTLVFSPTVSSLLHRYADKGAGMQVLYRSMAASIFAFFWAYLLAGSPVQEEVPDVHHLMTWQQRAVRAAFYLWVSLLNLVGMATLWARASDVFTPEAGTRLFGVLGAGATTGQLVASLLAAGAARLPVVVVGGVSLVPMLLSVCCLEAAGQLMSRVQLTAAAEDLARQRRQEPADPSTGLTPWASLLQGIRVIRGSGYLQRICVYVVFNYFVSSFFYFEKTIIVARVPDAGVRTTWFAMINSASASFILVLQLAVTGRVMRALGVPRALLLTPLAAAALMAGVAAAPAPVAIAAAEVTRKVLTYALARPTREVLFTVLSREEKYGAKVFMDTVVQRIGDAVPLCLAWAGAAWGLGRQHAAAAAVNLRLRKHSGGSTGDEEEATAEWRGEAAPLLG